MISSARLGSRERLVTYTVGFGVGLGLPLLLGIIFSITLQNPLWYLLPLPFLLAVLIGRIFRPGGFEISPNRQFLHILRRIGPKHISLTGLIRATPHPTPLPGGSLGLLSSQGYFGSYGYFWNRQRGVFQLHSSNSPNLIKLVWSVGGDLEPGCASPQTAAACRSAQPAGILPGSLDHKKDPPSIIGKAETVKGND